MRRKTWKVRRRKREPDRIYRITSKGHERHCPDCKEWKLANRRNFYVNKTAPDGCYVVCIPCKKIRQMEYELANPEKCGDFPKHVLERLDFDDWLEEQKERIATYGG